MDNNNASNIIPFPTHAGMGKASVINPSTSSKRPRPIVTEVTEEELAWDPVAVPQFLGTPEAHAAASTGDAEKDDLVLNGEVTRSGDSYAVVRPGHGRWPLGHVSDVYKPTGHRGTTAMVTEACKEMVRPFKKALMSGHGYRVAHQFHVLGEDKGDLHGLPVTSRLTVVHDHTGLHALRARMVVFVGNDTLGSFVGSRAIHVAKNPEKWRLEVEAMVAKSMKAQDALMDILKAADTHALTEADKVLLTTLKVNPPADAWGLTLLDSCVKYFKGKNTEMTWGVWERRLDDDAIRAMVAVLGAKSFGVPLDLALGGKRYGGKFTDEARKAAEKAAK